MTLKSSSLLARTNALFMQILAIIMSTAPIGLPAFLNLDAIANALV